MICARYAVHLPVCVNCQFLSDTDFQTVKKNSIIYEFFCLFIAQQIQPSHISIDLALGNVFFVTKIVLTYCKKNCSNDREKLLKFEAEGQEFAKILRSLEQFIQTVKAVKGQKNFWEPNAFLTCSWRFLISNKLEHLKFKLEKIIGMQKHAGKVRKQFFHNCSLDQTPILNLRIFSSPKKLQLVLICLKRIAV